jgi:hypothetical protein
MMARVVRKAMRKRAQINAVHGIVEEGIVPVKIAC